MKNTKPKSKKIYVMKNNKKKYLSALGLCIAIILQVSFLKPHDTN